MVTFFSFDIEPMRRNVWEIKFWTDTPELTDEDTFRGIDTQGFNFRQLLTDDFIHNVNEWTADDRGNFIHTFLPKTRNTVELELHNNLTV